MSMTRVKICGLMSYEDMQMAIQSGADSLGFVTEYPVTVPWNLSRQQATQLVAAAPPFVTTTAVVGGTVEEMTAIAKTVKPHFLQLHGDETLEEIQAVCQAMKPHGIKVLKALRIEVNTGQALFTIKDPLEACRQLEQIGLAGLVVDSKTATRPAGTGATLDWTGIRKISQSLSLPLILAGGLKASNVRQAIAMVRPYAVDVISGVEKSAGLKDASLMQEFVRAVKGSG